MAFRRAFAASTLAFLAMLVIQSEAGVCTCTCVTPQNGLQVDVLSCFLPGACDDCTAKCTAASTTLQESTCEMDGKEYGIYAAIVAALLIIPTVFTCCIARHRRKQNLPNTCGRMTAHWFGCFLLDIVWIPFCCCIERKGGSSDSGDRTDSRMELAPSGKGKSKSDEANDKNRSKDIDRAIQIDQRADMEAHKLLLLGAGESGKSTLFKQMITIYGKGFPEAERKTYKSVVMGNILASIKTLVQQSEHFGPVAPDLAEAKQAVEDQAKDDIDEKLGGLIMALWKDPGIQTTYDNRSKFQLTDSTAYFFERLPEVCKEGYIPSEQDVLRSRVRTTGIVENEFVIDGNQFKMYDVGGQRNERKKWIHCFENVTAVLFVAAISEYDQYLYEDENTNRMHEALNLFDSICNSKWFGKTSFILFLNKSDLFAEKIQKVPITVCFPDYKGEQAYEPSVAYIEQQFQDLNKNKDKKIYVHVTCATDTTLIRKVFHAVKDIVLRNALGESGLA